MFCRRLVIVAAFAVVSFPRPAPAGSESCTHPLFAAAVAYDAAGNGPVSVAIGDLDGINGPDLAVANFFSDDVSVLLNQGDARAEALCWSQAGKN